MTDPLKPITVADLVKKLGLYPKDKLLRFISNDDGFLVVFLDPAYPTDKKHIEKKKSRLQKGGWNEPPTTVPKRPGSGRGR